MTVTSSSWSGCFFFFRERRGFGGSSSAHFSGDSAAEDLARDQGKRCGEVPWNVRRLFWQGRSLQEVLRKLWQVPETLKP